MKIIQESNDYRPVSNELDFIEGFFDDAKRLYLSFDQEMFNTGRSAIQVTNVDISRASIWFECGSFDITVIISKRLTFLVVDNKLILNNNENIIIVTKER